MVEKMQEQATRFLQYYKKQKPSFEDFDVLTNLFSMEMGRLIT